MLAVIFEVLPTDEGKADYLEIAGQLKQHLAGIPGFISIERFQSLVEPGKILSLSFWRDEAAIRQWRNLEVHRAAQSRGREQLFRDYRIRVASVLRDYSLDQRQEAPQDSRARHG